MSLQWRRSRSAERRYYTTVVLEVTHHASSYPPLQWLSRVTPVASAITLGAVLRHASQTNLNFANQNRPLIAVHSLREVRMDT